jgi:hypothetical protein
MRDTDQLALRLPEASGPEVSAAEIAQLIDVLRNGWQRARPGETEAERARRESGWLTAVEIAALIGGEIDDRRVRKIASAARPAVVSFPGSKGYKAWELCTIDEAGHCIETFESQGSEMIKSAVLYRQAYHRRFRGAPGGACQGGRRRAN